MKRIALLLFLVGCSSEGVTTAPDADLVTKQPTRGPALAVEQAPDAAADVLVLAEAGPEVVADLAPTPDLGADVLAVEAAPSPPEAGPEVTPDAAPTCGLLNLPCCMDGPNPVACPAGTRQIMVADVNCYCLQ